MAADEYWLSAFYSHQGQVKPDQPDNSWDPSSFGFAYGGFGANGWGDLIPFGMTVPMTLTDSYETISIPLTSLPWTDSYPDGTEWAQFVSRYPVLGEVHDTEGAKMGVEVVSTPPSWLEGHGAHRFFGISFYPTHPDYQFTSATPEVLSVSVPGYVWDYRWTDGNSALVPYAYWRAIGPFTTGWTPEEGATYYLPSTGSGLSLASGYSYQFRARQQFQTTTPGKVSGSAFYAGFSAGLINYSVPPGDAESITYVSRSSWPDQWIDNSELKLVVTAELSSTTDREGKICSLMDCQILVRRRRL